MSTSREASTQRSLEKQYRQYAALRSDIGLVMTEQCPVGCGHCLASCDMHTPDLPALETHLAWIQKVSLVARCQGITITGGEPFLHFQRLLDLVEGCRAHGLRASVFTSGYWATSEQVTARKLQQLSEAGLAGISVSADEYHQESIPLSHAGRVLRAAQERGIARRIAITYSPHGRTAAGIEQDLWRELGRSALDGVQIEVGRIVKAGRARDLVFSQAPPAERSKLVCNALGPTIQRDGSVASCCRAPLPHSSPLVIGDLNTEDFQPVYRRFLDHPVIPFIQTWGLLEMLERLLDEGFAADLACHRNAGEEEMCELCQALLSRQAHVSFFAELFQEAEVRRWLGILTFLLYGDGRLLE